MLKTLRPYQTDAINAASVAFKESHRVLLTMPTGSGKTVTFSEIVKRSIARNIFGKVFLVFNRTELLRQSVRTLQEFGLTVDVLLQEKEFDKIENLNGQKTYLLQNRKINGRVMPMQMVTNVCCAMVKSLENAVDNGAFQQTPDFIVIDECHFGDFRKFITDYFPKTRILGVTATPVSASKKLPLSGEYGKLVTTLQNQQLVDLGMLIAPTHIRGEFNVKRSDLKKDKTGEYSDDSQLKSFAHPEVQRCFRESFELHGKNRHTLVFCVNIKDCEETAKMLGIPFFHSKNGNDHAQILADFRSGRCPAIATIGILATGFDFPPISCIILKRATTSLPLYLQMIGRGTRIFKGKVDCIVVDPFNNWEQFGLWEFDRDWESLFYARDIKEGVAGAKVCPKCDWINFLSAKKCKNPACEHVWESKEKKEQDIQYIGLSVVGEQDAAKAKINTHTCTIESFAAHAKLKDWAAPKCTAVIFDRNYSKKENTFDFLNFHKEIKQFSYLYERLKEKSGWVKYQIDYAKTRFENLQPK